MENELQNSLNELPVEKNFSVGNDLVHVPGFTVTFNELFKKKVYTAGEIAYCDEFADAILRYASTWAAKEAVYKAAKQLDQSVTGWKNIEISRTRPQGQPTAIIHKKSANFKISLTISHDGDYAWAIALIEK
jgi:phosphopantetheine--protein transferase-like protein